MSHLAADPRRHDGARGPGPVRFYVAALLVALLLAGLVSHHASADPDGLERVAADHGFDESASPGALRGSPVADYAVRGVDDERLSVGLAGVAGVVVTLLVAGGALLVLRRQRRPATAE